MINKYSRKDCFFPFPQSAPFIQPQSQHDNQQSIQQIQMHHRNHYHSDTLDLNETETHRNSYSKEIYQNQQNFKLQTKNFMNKQKVNIAEQLTSFKLKRNSLHQKNNEFNKNPSQTVIKKSINPFQRQRSKTLIDENSFDQNISEKYSQKQGVIEDNIRLRYQINKKESNENDKKILSRPRSGQLVSFNNLPSFKQNSPMFNTNKNSNKAEENEQIEDKQNNQPNSITSSNINKSDFESKNSLKNHILRDHVNQNNYSQINCVNFTKNAKNTKSQQNQLLLPIVNTQEGKSDRQSENNFNSNSMIDQSSISSICDSSRISQQDTQIAYLKKKLIETHSKLIKQLQISKQLEDNFFSLKKKYESLLNTTKNNKSPQLYQQKISQLIGQLRNKQDEWVKKQNEWKQKQQMWKQQQLHFRSRLSQHQQTRTQLQSLRRNQAILNQKLTQMQLNKYTSGDIQQIIMHKESLFTKQMDDKTNTMAQQNQKLLMKNQQLKNDLENMRGKVLALNKEKQELLEQIQELNQCQLKNQKEITSIQDKLSKRNKEFTEKEELCEIWRKKYSQVQQQTTKVQQNLIKHQKQVKQLKNLNCELNIALRQEKQKNAQMFSEIINIQMETKQLKSKISNLQEEKKELQDKLFEVTPQKNTLHQKQELQHQLQKLTTEYNSLSAIINKKEKDISELKGQLIECQSVLNKLLLREKQVQQRSRQLDNIERQIEEREKKLQHEQQKLNRMNSAKHFVNHLQQQKDRSLSVRRNTQMATNTNRENTQLINKENNRAKTPTNNNNVQKQNIFNTSISKIDSFANNNSRLCSPLSNNNAKITVPYEDKRNQKTSDQLYYQEQKQIQFQQNQIQDQNNQCITPSKSLHNLNVKTLSNNHSQPFFNHQKDNTMNTFQLVQNQYRKQQLNNQQNRVDDYQSYEDSLQNNNLLQVGLKNSIRNQFEMQKQQIEITHNKAQKKNTVQRSSSVTPLKQAKGNLTVSQSKPKLTSGSQRCLTSYKQEKQQYLSLLQQIGDLETQSYNLGQEKKKIIEEIQKIENTKVKTKEMIGRRRQLEMWLLGNQKKNNQVKEKLKSIRGKVV